MSREAMQTAHDELAALIPAPLKPQVDDWPCSNPADRECLQRAYTALRAALAEPVQPVDVASWCEEASEDVADWGGYASAYFQEKRRLQEDIDKWKKRAEQCRVAAPPTSEPVQPVSITPELIDRCAQRLASWDDGCVWPDSWGKLEVAQMRKDAEKVLREAFTAAPPGYVVVPKEIMWTAINRLRWLNEQNIADQLRKCFDCMAVKGGE